MVAKRFHSGNTFFFNNGGSIQIAFNPTSQVLDAPFRIHRDYAPIPVGSYDWTDYQVTLNSDPSRVVAVNFDLTLGELWTGTQRTVKTSVVVQPSYRLRASVALS